ncbi:MAG: PIN domain-containing protein [Bacteroidales bacterium]|nr:PIN domain-containing protein [Bacteroidales bacterium]
MKVRYYIDTSVFGGIFDEEFQEFSNLLFEKIDKEDIVIFYSELTEKELKKAPQRIKDFIIQLPSDRIEYLEISKEAFDLALQYISEKVVGETSYDDCVHIALATINRADVLISWNFKHIVNLKRIHGYNAVNMKLGYPILEIRSPKEMIDYEDKN